MFTIVPYCKHNIDNQFNVLQPDDECYAIGHYYSISYCFTDIYSQNIYNFKNKSCQQRDWLIQHFAELLINSIGEYDVTLIPIATSKKHKSEHYDDRLVLLCQTAATMFNHRANNTNNATYNWIDLFCAKEDIMKTSSMKISIREKFAIAENNICILEESKKKIDQIKEKVILVDDVFTSGVHFRICKNLLLKSIAGRGKFYNVYGLFLGRTYSALQNRTANILI